MKRHFNNKEKSKLSKRQRNTRSGNEANFLIFQVDKL